MDHFLAVSRTWPRLAFVLVVSEQYMAPLLSAMETGDVIQLHQEGQYLDGVPAQIAYAPDFLRALHNVRARPRRRLRRERAHVPVHRVRHVDRTTAIAALTSSAGVLLRESVDEGHELGSPLLHRLQRQ